MPETRAFSRFTLGFLATCGALFAIGPAAQASPVHVNFDDLDAAVGMTDANIRALLLNGGVEISTKNAHDNPLNIFDTSCTAHTCQYDPDLMTGGSFSKNRGNVLIVQEKNNSSRRDVDRPDDMIGSKIFFDFQETEFSTGLVDLKYVEMLDLDGAEQMSFKFWYEGEEDSTNWLAADRVRWMQSFDEETNTETWGSAERGGENSLSRYYFDHGDKKVAKVGVKMTGSGAVSKIKYLPVPPVPSDEPVEVPEPAAALGLLAFGAFVKTRRRAEFG